MTRTTQDSVPVPDGGVPVWLAGPEDTSTVPALVVVPSVFGPNEDLLAQMRSLGDEALTVVFDPFWRQGGGAMDYRGPAAAMARLEGFERSRCRDDIEAVTRWAKDRTNGEVVGLGICFGGPWVLLAAAKGLFHGAVTWHGSGMEGVLDRLGGLDAPLRFHFGAIDPITPPEVVSAISAHFEHHPDCRITVHPGADHGFTHEGDAWDPQATDVALREVRELLGR